MSLNGINKHPDLWFDDGNIILVAENTGFCVYQGMLTKQSEVFRDRLTQKPVSSYLGLFRAVFEIPQPSFVDSGFAGNRVVYLNDDGADEVATMLELLFDTRHSFYRNTEQVSFQTAAAALRLGTKYQFEEMREEALRRISACYSKDLDNLHTGADDCGDPMRCPIAWEEGDCIAVFHLARQLGIDDLVPAALYRCANDVTVEQLLKAASTHDRVYSLSFQELRDCIQSRLDLLTDNIKLYHMFSRKDAGCVAKAEDPASDVASEVPDVQPAPTPDSACRQRMKDIVVWAHEGGNFDGCLALYSMSQWIDFNTGPGALCSACGSHFKAIHANERKGIWTRLRIRYCGITSKESDGEDTVKSEDSAETAVSTRVTYPPDLHWTKALIPKPDLNYVVW